MTQTESSPLEITEQPHVLITLPDGCRLSARIWMPIDAALNPVPAILEYLPYRKRDGTVHRDELSHPWFAGHGYACIRVDIRGSGDSEGLLTDEYTPQELQDACDVIAWARAQPWCDGSVGMMGISWGGFNSLQVAALQPPGLNAIITLCSTVDRYADDIHYKGGCLLNENLGWAANMLSYASPPPDPLLIGDGWRALWRERLEHQPFLASVWLRHQHRDAYWQHGSVCEDYGAIKAAVLSIGGWHDGYRNTISHLVENITAPVKGIVGPWIHKYPHYAEPQPAIGFLQEALRWWNHWLKEKDNDIENEPDYRVWLMDSVHPARWLPERPGRWIAENTLPSPGIDPITLHLSSHPGAGRTLSRQPAPLQCDVATTQDCGSNTGEYFPFTFGPELPDSQNNDDAKSVCFDSDLLDQPLDIVGAPVLSISASADKTTGSLIVRLCDIRPDGTSALITMGLLNLTHRNSSEHPQKLTPGERFTTNIMLDHIAYRVPPGHQLRIALSTTYWPFVWPSPARSTITLQSGSVQLPVRTRANDRQISFEPAVAASGWQCEAVRATSSTRQTLIDENTGIVTTAIDNDFGENRDLAHGLLSGSFARERWSIHPDDPLSAKAEIHWQQTGGRDDWHWKTDALVTMHSDEQAFYLQAELNVFDNGELFFHRTFTDVIARDWI